MLAKEPAEQAVGLSDGPGAAGDGNRRGVDGRLELLANEPDEECLERAIGDIPL